MSAAGGRDGRIYAVGGDMHAPLRTVEVYDPATDAWSRARPLQIARRGPGVVAGLDGRIYAIGGYDSQRRGRGTTVEALDSSSGRWEEVAPMTDRWAVNHVGAVCASDGRIYALAAGGGERSPFELYEPTADRWTSLPSPNAKYADPALVYGSDGRIYAMDPEAEIGAGIAVIGPVGVEAYDPVKGEWQPVSSPSERRWGFAAAGLGGRVCLIGGNTHSPKETCETGGRAPSASEVYNPSRDRWEAFEALPTSRARAAAATGLNDSIYVIGGALLSGPLLPYYNVFDSGELVAHVEVYSP